MSRTKVGFRSASVAAYKIFKEQHPEIDITYRQFYEIIVSWNSSVMEYIIETGDEVKLPYGFGVLTIAKYKQKKRRIDQDGNEKINLAIDWVRSKQEGKRIYLMNFHTDGWKFFWKWDSKRSYFKSASIWGFKAFRYFSRLLAKELKTNPEAKHIYKDNTL